MDKYEKNSRDQIIRVNTASTFVEVMASAISIDKVLINFVAFDKLKPQGSRQTGSISFYLDILQAKVLADSISRGTILRQGQAATKKAKEENKKYTPAVYTKMGGVPAERANRADGKALSRTMSLGPGASQPWVLTAECGPGVPGPNGLLIVPDYGYGKAVKSAEMTIRVAMTYDKLEEFGAALQAAYDVWVMTRFTCFAQPEMDRKNKVWMEKYRADDLEAAAAAATTADSTSHAVVCDGD